MSQRLCISFIIIVKEINTVTDKLRINVTAKCSVFVNEFEIIPNNSFTRF